MMVPHVGTRNWINSINLTITDSNWDAWYANGQSAGYKTSYAHDNYTLVFATVKVQHVVEYIHIEIFIMLKKMIIVFEFAVYVGCRSHSSRVQACGML